MPDDKTKTDAAAREARASALRDEIANLAKHEGAGPGGKVSPREFTDAAARKAWEEAQRAKKQS